MLSVKDRTDFGVVLVMMAEGAVRKAVDGKGRLPN
jgi:hypothetical protein